MVKNSPEICQLPSEAEARDNLGSFLDAISGYNVRTFGDYIRIAGDYGHQVPLALASLIFHHNDSPLDTRQSVVRHFERDGSRSLRLGRFRALAIHPAQADDHSKVQLSFLELRVPARILGRQRLIFSDGDASKVEATLYSPPTDIHCFSTAALRDDAIVPVLVDKFGNPADLEWLVHATVGLTQHLLDVTIDADSLGRTV